MSVIQLQPVAEYTFRIDLEDLTNTIRIYWTEFSDDQRDMETGGFWSMDISNELFTIAAIKLVTGVELMWPYSQIKFGGFYLYDMDGENKDPEFIGVGDRWQLDYIPVAEVDAFRLGLNYETI